jgi:signal peptidase I
MPKEDSCSLIQDLLPLYHNHTISQETQNRVEEHLKKCEDCRVFLDKMLDKNIDSKATDKNDVRYINIAKKIKKRKIATAIFIVLFVISISIFTINSVSTVIIAGDSMEPTIPKGEKYIVNKLIYHFKKPKRFDIVIYQQNHIYYVSRIIGYPKETVEAIKGKVYINGQLLEYSFLPKDVTIEKFYISDNEYFVLQDHVKDVSKIPQCINENSIIGNIDISK